VHHDARIYIEARYDSDTADITIVHFRDRGILPIEAKTWQYSFSSPYLGSDLQEELKTILNSLWLAVYHDK
jgi:hypothetical protein